MTDFSMLRMPLRMRTGILAACMLAFAITPAHAGNWTLQALGTETGVWNTNPLMRVSGAEQLYGSITSPELILKSKTPLSQLDFNLRLDENIFNNSDFNSTDLHSIFNIARQTERWGAALRFLADYDTTRTSELTTYGTNTGVGRHLGFSAAPQLSYAPTVTDKIMLDTRLQTSRYYDVTAYSNYNVIAITPGYTHQFDPLNAGIVRGEAQRYSTQSGPESITDSVGPSFGWDATLTPRLKARAMAGVQMSRQYGSGTVSKPWTLQYTFSADIGFRGQQDTTDLTASRSQSPFGNGTSSLLTRFALKETHALNERLDINLGADYQYGEYQAASSGSLKYYVSGKSGLAWHATDHIDLTSSYQYRYEKLTDISGTAQDHAVMVGITYRPTAGVLSW